MTKEKDKGGLKAAVELVKEQQEDGDGKLVFTEDEPKRKVWKRNDAQALLTALTSYDSRKGSMEDYRQMLKVRDKVERAWRDDKKKVELSLDNAWPVPFS